uniref:Uncharacterized protein n=1 Tax=Pediastrum duplex TaxID=3105 RepID=A0A2U8GI81_PEDDU|nr:hypothetical protein [Pediastrum duplex]
MHTNVNKPKSLEAKLKHGICSFTSSRFFFVPSSFASVKFSLHLGSSMHPHSGRLLSLRSRFGVAEAPRTAATSFARCASATPKRNRSEGSRRSEGEAKQLLLCIGSFRFGEAKRRSKRKRRQSRAKTLN